MNVITVGTWAMVAAYAVAHDQIIVRIAAEHFTVYHPNVLGAGSAAAQAACCAFVASIGPGLAFGLYLAVAASVGNLPKLRISEALAGVAAVIAVTEVLSEAAGLMSFLLGRPLYPVAWYPGDKTVPLLVTQSIQITCYGSATVLSGLLLVFAVYRRVRLKKASFRV